MPEVKKKKKSLKIIRWILCSIGIIAVIILSASWYISDKLKPLLKKELKTVIKNSTFGLYDMNYSDVHINFVTQSVTIDDVSISPDTSVFSRQINSKGAPNNLYYVKLDKLLLKNIHVFKLYFGKRIKVNRIIFDNPEVKLVNKHFDFNDNQPPRPSKSPYEYISKFVKSVAVNAIEFKNVRFKYVDNNQKIPQIDSVNNLNVVLKDWLIDKTSAEDTTRMYLLKDINVYLNNYRYATPDSMYYIKVDQLNVAAAAGKVNIKQFALAPRYSQEDFAKVNGYARDRFSILMNNITLDSLSFPAYINKREIFAQRMKISDGTVSVYNDSSYPKFEKIRTGKFPHQLLQQLKALITIKKIDLSKIDISYAQYNPQSGKIGKITFENTSGLINNATNAAKAKAINPFMQADLKTEVMGQGKMGINFNFDLIASKGDFSYKGELLLLDGRHLNKITKPLGMLQINKGLVRSLGFDIVANQDVAKGKIDFRYNDLSVALFKEDEENDGLKRMGIISLLANALVISSDNPSRDGKYTSAPVTYYKKPEASFFNYMWRTIFEGIKFSVGFSPETQAEIDSQVNKFRKMREDRRERRERREERIEKRENENR